MIKIFLISAVIVATVNAGWEWKDDNENEDHQRFPRMNFPPLPPIPPLPQFPGFPPLPNFPQVPFPNFPTINIPQIKIPTEEDIVSHKGPGFHAIVSSTSDGGTVLTVNKDGQVSKIAFPNESNKQETVKKE